MRIVKNVVKDCKKKKIGKEERWELPMLSQKSQRSPVWEGSIWANTWRKVTNNPCEELE